MASKRKSTVPCMIPPKIIHMAEEQEASLPDRLPPPAKETFIRKEEEEEQAVRAQGSKDVSQSSWPEGGDVQQAGDSYSCRPCHFESQDLNLFLDHVYSGHPDFRADPSFYCVDCGVSTEKFEGLALHNARAHPNVGLAGSPVHTALQVRKRDRRTTVEQSLVGGEGSKESEISITKTPIMKMLGKGKSEHKRIVVSHPTGEEPLNPDSFGQKEGEKKDAPAAMPTSAVVHNGAAAKVPIPSAIQIVNGSGTLPVLKTAISQVVTMVQNRTPHQQSAPITVSSSSSSSSTTSSRNLPKVMIPLSSIPTYNAAMDSSSFLKTSFSKFPYPTKAELCYLTVVTKYPEEQIKIWFTAQRLKQGISWSPEEIEDSRRKMFNTIIQAPSSTPPQQSQHQQSRHAQHNPAQHTITVLPTPLGSNGIPHILQGSLMGQGGVIVTQPVIANGIQVGSTPVTLAVTPKPQARPQMQAKPAAALVADKGVSMVVGAVGSSSRITSSSSSSSSTSSTSSHTSIRSNGANNGNSSTSSTSKTNGDGGSKAAEAVALPAPKVAHSSRTLPSSFLDPSFYKSKKSQEQLGALKQSFVRCEFPGQEEVERLTKITGLTVREVRKWFSDRRYHNRNLKGSRPGGGVLFGGSSLLDLTDSPSPTGSPKPQQSSRSPPTASRRAPQAQAPDFTAIRYKERDPQQVRALEASFALDPLPSTEEVDRLRAETKMTRREIDGWFADRRKRSVPKRKGEDDEQEEEEEMEDEEADESRDRSLAGEERKLDAEDPLQGTSTQQHGKEEKGKDDALGGSGPKVNPIKINLKMLKVTKTEGKPDADGSQPERERESDSPKSPPLFTSGRGKKTAEQLHLLRQVFARTHWPSSLQYDELITKTGLPRPEVVRWFGDSRYVYKNGQLKWLESYQRAAAEEDAAAKEDTTVLKDHPTGQGKPGEEHSEGRGESGRQSEEHVHRGFGTQAPQPLEGRVTEEAGHVDLAPAWQDQGVTKETQPKQNENSVGTREEPNQVTSAQAVKPSSGGD
ncbi:zinc fingers and homeoboxes protein 3 [Megalops cyprinoides]|uniref:zinc fingers and homeoboxes protein 3 n=1 Tax=Megalops cyprinoides TaxID=118141 RepID=UPI0018656627|nr:zinc fingers and homeoboxes protein 3 [Megalops cyprinoides]